MSKFTFIEILEANNKMIKKDIMKSIKTEMKLANDEPSKKVEKMCMTFQSFMSKNQSNANQSSLNKVPNHQQPLYTVPQQACPQYYPPSPSFYSQSAMNQLHGFITNPGVNQPILFNSVTHTLTQEPLTQELPKETNPANE